jgi:two-component sensor histidine kinase
MGGLIKWSLKEKKVDRFDERKDDPNSLSNNTVNNIVRRNDGQYFVCTNTGVSLFNNETNKTTRLIMPGKNGLNYPQVNTLLEDGEIIWIGTYGGGLNKYYRAKNSTEYLTEKEGLANNDIYAIYKTPDNRLWISTNNGISVYDINAKRFRNFDKSNGLLDNEFNRNSNFQLGDTLYFGGITGLCYFNYKNIMSSSVAPYVDITKITSLIAGSEKTIFPDNAGRIKTSFSQSTIKLYLSSPFYINPAKTNFKYRLLPGQTDWISNGTNNELILTHLPPGKHTLEVISISSEGVESYNTKQLFIHITPPWYQTNLFKILLGVFAAGILFSFYRLRLHQIKKELQIRNQLASDLHDDLGSTLNSIKVHSNLAMLEKEKPAHLENVKQGTQDAINSVRDIMWVLDDKKDKVSDMLARINQFAVPLCEANHIVYSVVADYGSQDFLLGNEEKRNLYMIIKESVNNSIKYSDCKTISVTIERKGRSIRIEVKDDGKGFKPVTVAKGYGLKNIASRAAAINYRHTILSETGKGTRILLEKK